jgi:hypothetical protein
MVDGQFTGWDTLVLAHEITRKNVMTARSHQSEREAMTQPGNRSIGDEPEHHPNWVIPFWMLAALVAMFIFGCGCGAIITGLLGIMSRGSSFD